MDKTIGQNLTKLRIEKGMSKSELSKKSGVHRRTILRIENDITRPRDYIIAKLAKALDCKIKELD